MFQVDLGCALDCAGFEYDGEVRVSLQEEGLIFFLLRFVPLMGGNDWLGQGGSGMLNSYAAVILPFSISWYGIFLMRQFFLGVPDDLVDAARIDGMSEYGIVWSVMAPAAIPALVAFGIFSVVAHWNDYFWPLIAVGNQGLYTPPLGIAHLKLNGEGTAYGPLMAAATIVIAPLVLAFLVAQRRFVEGITFTGLKG